MWKYQHPDFALFLLGELQKQQQGSIFCDTLLQTEGVCIPAHSCVLAALSPVFSRIISTSPAPHAGQNRLLSLEAVGSHALLKLVGFLYTGEMELESRSEHEEVMAAAHRLGLRNLLEKRRTWIDRGVVAVESYWKETGVRIEDAVECQESEMVSEPLKIQRSSAPVTSVQPCVLLEPELPSSQLLDEASPTRGFNLNSNVTVDMTEESNHHKAKAKRRWKMAKRESQLKKLTPQLLNVEGAKSTQAGVVEKSRNVSGKDFQKLLEADTEQKNTTTEQKEAQMEQFKVRIKLSRRRGACWQSNLLVSLQGESEEKPEESKECGSRTPSYPSSVLPGQSRGLLTPPTDLPISPSNSSTQASSDKSLHTPHHISVSAPLDIPTLSSSPPQADESDEHIAMLLEEMFMMGLNILPLVPLDRTLNEQDQLGYPQEQKGGHRDTESSTQSCVPELRVSDVSKKATSVESPGQRDEDHSGFHSQSRSNTVELLTQSPEQDNLNQAQNLANALRNFSPSFREEFILTPKATAFPDSVAAGEMPSLVMLPDDRPDFTLLKCLSPIESEKGDSDVPSKQEPSHRENSKTQNFPLWLSESPVIFPMDFPLSSMIDSSCPHPQCDLNACQNRPCPDLAEMQELKTSCSQNDLISGSSIQPDVSNASEHPKWRKTRKRRVATEKSKVKRDTEHRNLEKEDQVQPSISGCDEPHCVNIETSNSNTYGVSTRMTNANSRAAAGVKRRRDISSPLRRKLPLLNTASKQRDHVDILPQPKLTGVVKRGRGRQPKTKNNPVACLSTNAKNMPTSGQDDCEVEKTKTDNEIEQGKQKPNTQQEKDSTEMEAVDINRNCAQAMPSSHLKYAGKVKGPTILDQIFHQALPSVASPPCKRSNFRLTSSLRGTSFSRQNFQGEKSEDVKSKLVMNSSEQINTGICGDKKAEISVIINEKEDAELAENHVRSLFSCKDIPDNVKCSVKDRNMSMEEDSVKTATVLQNSDFRNETRKEIQDRTTEISVLVTSEENRMKNIMTPVEDIDDADHDLSPRKTDYVVTTNELTVMEGIEMSFCLNADSTHAEHFKEEQNLEATSSNDRSFEMTSGSEKENTIQAAHDVDTQEIGWVADCLENNEKEDLSRNKENQMIENMVGEETEIWRAHEFAVQNALLDSNEGRWETTNGLNDDDDDDINAEGAQYSAEMIDGENLLEEEELSQGHLLSTKIAVDPSKGACPPEILSTDSPYVQAEGSSIHSPNVCSGGVLMVLSVGVDSESKDDCHLEEEEEDIEVDVVGDSVEEFPLGLLAARQMVTLPIEGPLDQEDELDTTEEEEVDVTGEDTE